jgi:hypothetical protein
MLTVGLYRLACPVRVPEVAIPAAEVLGYVDHYKSILDQVKIFLMHGIPVL